MESRKKSILIRKNLPIIIKIKNTGAEEGPKAPKIKKLYKKKLCKSRKFPLLN